MFPIHTLSESDQVRALGLPPLADDDAPAAVDCQDCVKWQAYSKALDDWDGKASLASQGVTRADPCPTHDGWTFAEVSAKLWAHAGQVNPLSIGAVLNSIGR